jgi:hypothetical protein
MDREKMRHRYVQGEGRNCSKCNLVHTIVPRSEVLDELAAVWNAGTHWFTPATGQMLLTAAEYMENVADMLYLDAPESCLVISPPLMDYYVCQLPEVLPPDLASGIFTVPVTTPREKMALAFPGHFGDDGEGLEAMPEDAKVLVPIGEGETKAGFSPLMLDVMAWADPGMAMEVAEWLAANRVEPPE